MYSYEMETKETKIQNKNKIELEQIHLSYTAFTFFNAFQNYEFNNNNIHPETFSVMYIF